MGLLNYGTSIIYGDRIVDSFGDAKETDSPVVDCFYQCLLYDDKKWRPGLRKERIFVHLTVLVRKPISFLYTSVIHLLGLKFDVCTC